jgi:hypothetical protein
MEVAKNIQSDDFFAFLKRLEGCYDPTLPRETLAKDVGGTRLVRHEYSSHKLLDLRYVLEPNHGLDLDGADWADFDQQGRLVFAQNGKLFAAARVGQEWQTQELADLRENKFEEVVAPEWAQIW